MFSSKKRIIWCFDILYQKDTRSQMTKPENTSYFQKNMHFPSFKSYV